MSQAEVDSIVPTILARTPDSLSREEREFLQSRIGGFGLMAGGGSAFFLLYRTVQMVVRGELEFLDPTYVLHSTAAVILLAVWALCRGPVRSARYLLWVEAIGLLLACACYAAMGAFIPRADHPELIMVLALNTVLVARAIYVPSTARRTLAFGAVIAIPLLLSTYFNYLGVDREKWKPLYPRIMEASPEEIAFTVTLTTATWWALIVGICTAASHVIYGLRRQVSDVRRLGQYTLEEKLGEGGMGMVYRASHAMLRRATAVKLLPPEKAGEENLSRFEREVQLTARLTHPNTVTVFDFGRTPDGVFYYAMEYLDGANLQEIVEVDGPQPVDRVVAVLLGVAGALVEAHGVGLIHRDIKPANILLCEKGGVPDVVKVVDFGLVKEVKNDAAASLSQANVITGTPQYLAPETLTSPDAVDGRSDLYSLGLVAYFLLTGRPTFDGSTVVEVCSQQLHGVPEPISKHRPVPHELERLVLSCLAKDPEERPASSSDLHRQLRTLEGVGAWSADRATAWWSAHGDQVRSSRSSTVLDHRTIDVDWAARRS